MSEFKLILTNNKNIKNTIYPMNLELEDKMYLKEKMDKEKDLKLYCNCNRLQLLEYKVSSDFKIYPCKNNYVHAEDCQKSKKYISCNKKYNKNMIQKQDGDIIVSIPEDLAYRDDDITDFYPKKISLKNPNENILRDNFQTMIKRLNILTFKQLVFRPSTKKIVDSKEFKDKFFGTTMKTIINKKPLGEYSIKTDGFKFIYCRFHRYVIKGKIVELYDKDFKFPYKVPLGVFLEAKKDFGNDFNKNNIVFFGLQHKHKIYGNQIYRLYFIETNKYGLFVENEVECTLCNYICDFINQHNLLARGVRFYKPYEFGFSVYENNYLEDGIIELDNSDNKYIFEIQYKKNFRTRKKYLNEKYTFIEYKNNNDNFPNLSFLI